MEVVVILHPAEGGRSREIGRMRVINDASHPEHPEVGNYNVDALRQREGRGFHTNGRVVAWGREGNLWAFLAKCAGAVR